MISPSITKAQRASSLVVDSLPCYHPMRSFLYKTSSLRAEVVEVARLAPLETGVDTHTHAHAHTLRVKPGRGLWQLNSS